MNPWNDVAHEAAALLRRWPDGEPVGYLPAYELDRLQNGHDGRLRSAKFGPSALDGDIALYTTPPAPIRNWDATLRAAARRTAEIVHPGKMVPPADQSERIAELEAERSALRTALEFASAAVEDAIYTEDGIDGQDGERLLYIFREALERGTFDKVRYGDLPPMLLEVRNNALEAALEQARVALENVDMAPLVRDALRAIEEMRK